MKVLFAINNDNISNAIIKKYQKQYKEIISYKNVYYFNAILKELQKDKSYDRVVISEDLEPFANNDFDTINKFIFEKLDKISDEATNQNGDDIPIILICSDRITKSDTVLVKFFGIGIYNAIIGNDRKTDEVCRLINQPRTKKEAKIYYKIESSSVNYQSESENSVSETEVQNILAHYKRLSKNEDKEDKYVDSFNTIVAQYTDEQLKIIIKCLPINVKAVLEERSPKYQQLATFLGNKDITRTNYIRNSTTKKEPIAVKMLKEESNRTKFTRPIVVPSSLKKREIKKVEEENNIKIENQKIENSNQGYQTNGENNLNSQEKRGRGRPKKQIEIINTQEQPKRGRGRPKKESKEEELVDIFNIQPDDAEDIDVPEVKIKKDIEIPDINIDESIDLFSLGDENEVNKPEEVKSFKLKKQEKDEYKMKEDKNEDDTDTTIDLFNIGNTDEDKEEDTNKLQAETNAIEEPQEIISKINTPIKDNNNTLMIKDKKVVCFVGTTKNGTSFLVNNLARMLADMNIPTAILDLTKTKNAYYIYTNNEEKLRNIATQSIKKLEEGIAEGIDISKMLSVYTALPEEEYQTYDATTIISTLLQKHSVILIDCDFETQVEFFEKAQEIYIVQTQDVLTIQPLTAFLRNLKAKNILKQEKLKIVINKELKIKGLTDKILIGGIANYNDPAMSFMTELFNKETIKYCKIPFEMQNYAKYLSGVVNCSITLNGYTKQFIGALQELAEMVYPLMNKPKYSSKYGNKKEKQIFSSKVNNTLDKMKNNY